jgi:hypothetical protein
VAFSGRAFTIGVTMSSGVGITRSAFLCRPAGPRGAGVCDGWGGGTGPGPTEIGSSIR